MSSSIPLSGSGGRGHRSDIDGLRAIAILPVLFFHAGLGPFAGGFTGVDVFFVISGYLITSVISREIARGEFSIVSFYERRIRKIFPALFLVLCICVILAMPLVMPLPFLELGESVAAAAAFASNILFAAKTGYFALAANQKPLLHTWSLAIEEQFYLLFPLLLLCVGRISQRGWKPALFFGILFSFAFNLWQSSHNPSLAFYSALARAWELLLGAIIALGAFPPIRQRRWRNVACLVGLFLIGSGIVFYKSTLPFPGWFVLMPTLGAALVLHAGEKGNAVSGTFLSARPLVFVGLISYSLYLWHWPLLVFGRLIAVRPLATEERFGILALSFLLAWLSWKFVEQPFRNRARFTRSTIFILAGACVFLCLTFGVIVYRAHDGFPQRFRGDVRLLLAAAHDTAPDMHTCPDFEPGNDADTRFCRIGARTNGPPGFLIWGDSHAAAMAPAIALAAARRGVRGLVVEMGGCPPFMGVDSDLVRPAGACERFNADVMEKARADNIRTIFLDAYWPLYANGNSPSDNPGTMRVYLSDAQTKTRSLAENKRVLAAGLARTVLYLRSQGRQVFVVGPVPEVSEPVPQALATRILLGKDRRGLEPRMEQFVQRQKFVLATLSSLQAGTGAGVLSPYLWLCDQHSCRVEVGNVPLYFDDNHLSLRGAEYLSRHYDSIFSGN